MGLYVVDIYGDYEGDMDIIKEYEEPKGGHWINKDKQSAICSCCNRYNALYGNFCKWRGALIDDKESEE